MQARRVQWIRSEPRRVAWLGLRTGDVIKAKALLLAFEKAMGSTAAVPDYGTVDDLSGSWTGRNQAAMDQFVDYWTAKGGQPPAFKQLFDDTPTIGQVEALQAWQKSYVPSGNFPTYGGSSPAPSGGGIQVVLPPVPQVPQLCPEGRVWNAQTQSCVRSWANTPLAPTGSSSTESKSVVPLLLGGAALLGIAWLIFRAPKLQENPNLISSLSSMFGSGTQHEALEENPQESNEPLSRLETKEAAEENAAYRRSFGQSVEVHPITRGRYRGLWGVFETPKEHARRVKREQREGIRAPTQRRTGRHKRGRKRRMRENAGDRVYMERVRLNRGGYDQRGRYFGVGKPLYEYSDGRDLHGYVRAYDRQAAKAEVRAKAKNKGYPSVTFYRG